MPQKFQTLKKAKRLTKSSQKWLLRQINDPFVERAKLEGWRSRAAFKIIEIDQKFKIFKKGKITVDLGAAPGGWSQYAVQKVGEGNVFALDLLTIDPIQGVKFLQQDFFESDVAAILGKKCDVLLSDMAANATGDHQTDHLRIVGLLEESLNLAEKILNEGGVFVGKIFQGGSSNEILQKLRKNFSTVKYFKPKSSRKDSSETYLVALGFRVPLAE
ncbi:MAG: RlmE family RNA methyltransferase [Alphaproteobacteria bacterium]|nr:RlmE family RNA methyltransferase [Alphaproteobacteria bacterium]